MPALASIQPWLQQVGAADDEAAREHAFKIYTAVGGDPTAWKGKKAGK